MSKSGVFEIAWKMTFLLSDRTCASSSTWTQFHIFSIRTLGVGTLSSLFSEFSKNSVYQKQDAHLGLLEAWATGPISARRGAIRRSDWAGAGRLLEKKFEREKIFERKKKWVTADKWRTHHRARPDRDKMDHWVRGVDFSPKLQIALKIRKKRNLWTFILNSKTSVWKFVSDFLHLLLLIRNNKA